MAEYATLSFKISGAKDEAHPTDNLFRVTRAHYNTLGNYNGNQGNDNTFGSNNIGISVEVKNSGTDSGAQNRPPRSVFVVGEAGIIRTPESYLVKN